MLAHSKCSINKSPYNVGDDISLFSQEKHCPIELSVAMEIFCSVLLKLVVTSHMWPSVLEIKLMPMRN